jgi:hypothetical protein
MKNQKINFIASVNDDRIEDVDAIAKKLQDLGCTIDNILSFSGVITGSTTTDISFNDLKIDGIKNVESDRKVKAISKPTDAQK